MRIPPLTHAFDNLTQRIDAELRSCGHVAFNSSLAPFLRSRWRWAAACHLIRAWPLFSYRISWGVNPGEADVSSRWKNYKENVGKVLKGGNPYEDMRAALARVGVTTAGQQDFLQGFGVTLATRQAVEIGRGLAQLQVAGETLTETSVGPDLTAEQEAQLWAQAEPIFEQLTQSAEEKMMWVPDVVNAGWLTGAVIAVSAVSPSQAADNFAYGVCQTAIPSMGAEIYPTIDADSYLNSYHRSDAVQKNFSFDSDSTKVTLIKAPKLGKLVSDEGQWSFKGKYHYWSDKEDGQDRFVIQVENDGIKVRIHYLIKLRSDPHSSFGNAPSPDDCGSGRWKISQSDFDSSTQDYAAWLRSSELSTLIANANQTLTGFQDLAGSSVGQTTGEGSAAQIILDFTAAGHGWYVDPTPLDNTDDYLPTSDANIWQAKAGSDADGKMDMLSVLLHEYGHALGLEHSADSGDFMAATLQAGQRRMPSADELTLMSQLVAQLKASTALADGSPPTDPTNPTAPNPSLPLGALLIGRLALGRKPEDAEQGSQALFSANPTLQGGNLSTLQDWATQGRVVASSAASGAPTGATLEVIRAWPLLLRSKPAVGHDGCNRLRT